ncbi:hypothetical protein [Flavobacterium sp. GCM10023249]|uniref:hypothetical protein n=1 Tax=unclassified Flavobacterium TaxID=196869 RepID=UPI00360984F9
MIRYTFFIGAALLFLMTTACKETKAEATTQTMPEPPTQEETKRDTISTTTEYKQNPTDFIPKGFVLFEKILGDVNKDGVKDCVLIIKGTDQSKFVTDEYRGKLDRNRRGIIVLLNRNKGYELAVKNYNCFSSENEDGGVYFAPDLMVSIEKGNLYIHYAHGRYGYWKYTFRYQNSDFELIGYDQSENNGPIVNVETSINFLTKKKVTKVNTNDESEGGDEIFETTTTKIKRKQLYKLTQIKDFNEFEMNEEG